MEKEYRHYFKVLNNELFGGKGSEGYISLRFANKESNPTNIAKKALSSTEDLNDVEYIEISREEYLRETGNE